MISYINRSYRRGRQEDVAVVPMMFLSSRGRCFQSAAIGSSSLSHPWSLYFDHIHTVTLRHVGMVHRYTNPTLCCSLRSTGCARLLLQVLGILRTASAGSNSGQARCVPLSMIKANRIHSQNALEFYSNLAYQTPIIPDAGSLFTPPSRFVSLISHRLRTRT